MSKIRLADNYMGAMVNIAQIAATNSGNQVLSQLIKSGDTYTMNSVFWSTNSEYDVSNREINYVGSPLINTVGGGAWNSMLAMGHEHFMRSTTTIICLMQRLPLIVEILQSHGQ